MRSGHEALRNGLKQLEKTLKGPKHDREKFFALWEAFLRSMTCHMDIEENDMFKLLDESSQGELANGGLFGIHMSEDQMLRFVVQPALPKKGGSDEDWNKFTELWMGWMEAHEQHYGGEERLMMPLTQKTGATAEERSLVVHYRIIKSAMKRMPEDFMFHMAYCVDSLSKFGSLHHNALDATAVYLRGLKAACNEEQWKQFCPKLKEACVPEIWKELNSTYDIESTKVGLVDLTVLPPDVAHAEPGSVKAKEQTTAQPPSADIIDPNQLTSAVPSSSLIDPSQLKSSITEMAPEPQQSSQPSMESPVPATVTTETVVKAPLSPVNTSASTTVIGAPSMTSSTSALEPPMCKKTTRFYCLFSLLFFLLIIVFLLHFFPISICHHEKRPRSASGLFKTPRGRFESRSSRKRTKILPSLGRLSKKHESSYGNGRTRDLQTIG
jgi:hypothetical protein